MRKRESLRVEFGGRAAIRGIDHRFSSRHRGVDNGYLGRTIVQECSHPSVPNIKEGTVVVPHIGMMIVVMGDVVESPEHPVLGHPVWNHLIAGVPCNVDHRVVGEIRKQYDRLERDEDDNQTEASKLQYCF